MLRLCMYLPACLVKVGDEIRWRHDAGWDIITHIHCTNQGMPGSGTYDIATRRDRVTLDAKDRVLFRGKEA